MIYSIIGQCGGGKTLLMTYLAYKDFLEGMPVYSNYKLNFKFTQLTNEFFQNYLKFPIYKATVCFDELSIYYSARRSFSKENAALRPFILQTRKRDLKLIYTAQQNRLCDINIRENTDGMYLPQMLVKRGEYPYIQKPENWKHKKGDTYILKYEYYNRDGVMTKKAIVPVAETIFNLYDTHEILQFDVVKEKEKVSKK